MSDRARDELNYILPDGVTDQKWESKTLKQFIMAWHERHSPAPRVPSKVEVLDIIRKSNGVSCIPRCLHCNSVADDIYALFTEPRKEKVWCPHIKRVDIGGGFMCWELTKGTGNKYAIDGEDDIKFCPRCSKPRPTEET